MQFLGAVLELLNKYKSRENFKFLYAFTKILTFLFTSWNTVHLEKLTGFLSASQEIPRILWKQKFYYRSHNNPIKCEINDAISRCTQSYRK